MTKVEMPYQVVILRESGGSIRWNDYDRWRQDAGSPPARRSHKVGAGEGDRTLTASLEGWSSTIELHPHSIP